MAHYDEKLSIMLQHEAENTAFCRPVSLGTMRNLLAALRTTLHTLDQCIAIATEHVETCDEETCCAKDELICLHAQRHVLKEHAAELGPLVAHQLELLEYKLAKKANMLEDAAYDA